MGRIDNTEINDDDVTSIRYHYAAIDVLDHIIHK